MNWLSEGCPEIRVLPKCIVIASPAFSFCNTNAACELLILNNNLV